MRNLKKQLEKIYRWGAGRGEGGGWGVVLSSFPPWMVPLEAAFLPLTPLPLHPPSFLNPKPYTLAAEFMFTAPPPLCSPPPHPAGRQR